MNEFRKLSIANKSRQVEWDPEGKTSSFAYRAAELGGEAGEACNELKKLEREKLGIRGSRTTKEKLAEELADVVICASLAANVADIDLWAAVVAKFNKTSEAVGLSVKLEEQAPVCSRCGHSCPADRLCDKCGGDPLLGKDKLCVECDRAEIEE